MCFINNTYRNINIESLKPGMKVKTLTGNSTIVNIIKTQIRNNTQNLMIYRFNNLYVSANVGIIDGNICYGKIDEQYIITASSHSQFRIMTNIRVYTLYTIITDTTDEFPSFYAYSYETIKK